MYLAHSQSNRRRAHLVLRHFLRHEHEVAQECLVALHRFAQLREAISALGDDQKVDGRLQQTRCWTRTITALAKSPNHVSYQQPCSYV